MTQSGSKTLKCSVCGGPKVTLWAETCRKCWPASRRIGRPTTLGTPPGLSVSDPKVYGKHFRAAKAEKIKAYYKEWSKTHKRGKFSWSSMAHACRLAARTADNPHLRDTLNCAASIFGEVCNSPNDPSSG